MVIIRNRKNINTMKKLIFILVAVISFQAVSAQQGYNSRNNNDRYPSSNGWKTNDRYDKKDQGHLNDVGYSNDRGYSNDHSYNQQDRRYDERNHQADVDRVNREYDQRIAGYGNDRSINS